MNARPERLVGNAEALRRLQLVTFALAEALAPEQVGAVLVREGAAATGASAVTVFLLDDAGTELSIVASTGLASGVAEKWKMVPTALDTPLSCAARTGVPVLIASREEWTARFAGGPAPSPTSAAWAVLPLIVKGRTIGVFGLVFGTPQSFAKNDVELLTAMAEQCAQAFDRARLYESERAARAKAEGAADRIARLQQSTAALGRALDPEAVADAFLSAAVEHLGACSGFVALSSTDGNHIELLSQLGGPPRFIEHSAEIFRALGAPPERIGSRYLFDLTHLRTPLAIALRTRTPVYVEELGTWHDESGVSSALLALGRGSTACLPLIAGGVLVGALRLTFDGKRTFLQDERSFIGALAELGAQALDRARLYEAERRTAEQRALLAEAGAHVSESLDSESIKRVVDLAVPRFADYCSLSAYEGPSLLRSVATAPSEGPGADTFAALSGCWQLQRSQRAIRVTNASHAIDGQTPRFHELFSELAARSFIVAPVGVRDEVFGWLCFVATERNFTASDQFVAEELARRAGAAMENARLFERAVADRELAERAISMRDEFLSIVAHDLGSPLNAIGLWANILFRDAASGSKGEATREVASKIKGGIRRMNALLHDLLDVASIERGQLSTSTRGEQIGALVKDAIDLLGPLAAEKGIALEGKTSDAVAARSASCDVNRIQQVFGNLVGNAVKFTPRGGSITVSAEQGAAREIEFAVTDTGSGISPDACEHIFDRFWRGAPRDAEGGVGLGLFIAKGIVEAHGGKLWVESTLGRGTTFRFTLLEAGGSLGEAP